MANFPLTFSSTFGDVTEQVSAVQPAVNAASMNDASVKEILPTESVSATPTSVTSTLNTSAVTLTTTTSAQITTTSLLNETQRDESITASQVTSASVVNTTSVAESSFASATVPTATGTMSDPLLTEYAQLLTGAVTATATPNSAVASLETTDAIQPTAIATQNAAAPTAFYEPIVQGLTELKQLDGATGETENSNALTGYTKLATATDYVYAKNSAAGLSQIERDTLTENWSISREPEKIQPTRDGVVIVGREREEIYKYDEFGNLKWSADHAATSFEGVEKIGVTPNGNVLTWSDQDAEIKLWDADTGSLLQRRFDIQNLSWIVGRSDNTFTIRYSGSTETVDQTLSTVEQNTVGETVFVGIEPDNTIHTVNFADDKIIKINPDLTAGDTVQLQHNVQTPTLDNSGGYYYNDFSDNFRRVSETGDTIWSVVDNEFATAPNGVLFPGEFAPQQFITATKEAATAQTNTALATEFAPAVQFGVFAETNTTLTSLLEDAQQVSASVETSTATVVEQIPSKSKFIATSDDGTTKQLSDDFTEDWSVAVQGDSVAADSKGNTYIAADDGNLYKYDSSGSLVATEGRTIWESVDYNDAVGRLVVGSNNGEIHIFENGDFSTQPTLGSTAVGTDRIESILLTDSNNVYAGQSGSTQPAIIKTSLDSNGVVSQKWTYDTGNNYGVSRDIAYYNGSVYAVFSSDGRIFRLDDTDGTLISDPFEDAGGALAIDETGGNLVYSTGIGNVESVTYNDIAGTKNWTYGATSEIRGNISISNGRAYFGDTFDGAVYKIDVTDGSEQLKSTSVHTNSVTWVDTYEGAPTTVAAKASSTASMNSAEALETLPATQTSAIAPVSVAVSTDETPVFVTPPDALATMNTAEVTEPYIATQFTASAQMRSAVAANISADKIDVIASMNATTVYPYVDETTASVQPTVTQPQSTLVIGQGESSVPVSVFATSNNIFETARAETSSQKSQVLTARTPIQGTGNADSLTTTLQPSATITASDLVPPILELDSVLTAVDVSILQNETLYTVPTETSLISIAARDTGTFARRTGFRLPIDVVSRTDLVDVSTQAKVARLQRINTREIGDTTST